MDEEIIPSSEVMDEMVRGERGLTCEEVLQLKRLEIEECEKEQEACLRLKELEFKEKELSLQVKLKELEVRSKDRPEAVGVAFDVSKYVKLVPDFWETEVDKYFLHFEKVASNLKWPEDNWALLLQSSLVGKAREVYAALSVDESAQYSVVKNAILKAYELVPEAYRQRFQNSEKHSNQTHVEFAMQKETLFDRWCMSKEIGGSYDKLRQLFLIEEFKNCLPGEVRTYLDERKAVTLNQAAVLADNYILTHKN